MRQKHVIGMSLNVNLHSRGFGWLEMDHLRVDRKIGLIIFPFLWAKRFVIISPSQFLTMLYVGKPLPITYLRQDLQYLSQENAVGKGSDIWRSKYS